MKNRARIVILMMTAVCLAAGLGALAMTGCSSTSGSTSNTEDEEAEEAEEETASFVWTAASDCISCHTTEADSMTDASCQISASHGSLDCVTCHTDTETLTTVHAEVDESDYKAPTKLSDTEVSSETCLSCHDLDAIIEATTDLTVLTDDNGTTVNPHDLPEVSQHESITCSSCHDMHDSSTAEEKATTRCASCHHAGVYECYTCH